MREQAITMALITGELSVGAEYKLKKSGYGNVLLSEDPGKTVLDALISLKELLKK